jgi:hypothetical protein
MMKTTCDVEETVKIPLSAIVEWCSEGGFEMMLDKLAEKTGHPELMEINFDVIGHEQPGDVLIFKVTGCVEVKEEEHGKDDSPAP